MSTDQIEAGTIPIENPVFGYQGVLRRGSDGVSESAAQEWLPAIECSLAELQKLRV